MLQLILSRMEKSKPWWEIVFHNAIAGLLTSLKRLLSRFMHSIFDD